MNISGIALTAATILLCACTPTNANSEPGNSSKARISAFNLALASTRTARVESQAILGRIEKSPVRFETLLGIVRASITSDPWILALVDKLSALPADYVPDDLVSLDGTGLSVSKKGLSLRKSVLEALLRMDKAARSEGITLVVSSTYRSYAYQSEVYALNVREMGETEASRVSARPGHSQHQLGTALDFGSIDNSFTRTKAGLWLVSNAARFGFSQSYPKGMESVTGYLWESWHYRYIGYEATMLQNEYFGGIQQYLMEFLAAIAAAPLP